MPANGHAKSLRGRRVAMVSGHHLATRAAASMLDQGGSLVDAMLAASAVLTVALPHTSSLGGCAMGLFFHPSRGISALNGTGRSPMRATRAAFGKAMPRRGARAAVTPTLVRFWARAHQAGASLPWADFLAPAIALADEGCPAADELIRNLHNADPSLRQQPGFRQAFAPAGAWLAAGELMAQPALAAVLRKIAEQGEDGFYRGDVADSLVACSAAADGLLQHDDLLHAQADWVQPWQAEFAGAQVHVMPPNSMGPLMLAQLQCGAGQALDAQVAQAAQLIGMGQRQIGDAARSTLQPGFWNNADFSDVAQVRAEPGDTTGFVAVDAEGHAVAMLQSVFQPFGSGVVDTATGVLLNNRMYDFTLEAGHVNEIAPGVRPAHTLNPYLVTRQGAVLLAGASPGGVSQTITGAQVLRGAIQEPERSLGEIVSRDRWSLGRDGTVLLEAGIPSEVAARLRANGLNVTENSQHEFYFGSAKMVRANPNRSLEAAADPRRQAHAAAW